jgi:hypothetical protein
MGKLAAAVETGQVAVTVIEFRSMTAMCLAFGTFTKIRVPERSS